MITFHTLLTFSHGKIYATITKMFCRQSIYKLIKNNVATRTIFCLKVILGGLYEHAGRFFNLSYKWRNVFEANVLRFTLKKQGMLTPPRHLIIPMVYPGILISPFISLICNSYLCFETDHFLVSLSFLESFFFLIKLWKIKSIWIVTVVCGSYQVRRLQYRIVVAL
jgi:hypothetical protein